MKTVTGFKASELAMRIKNKFEYVLYSPSLNKFILIDGGKSEHLNTKGVSTGYWYCYADENLFGKYMRSEKLEKLYPYVITEIQNTYNKETKKWERVDE